MATANCLNGFFVHPYTDATIAEALLRKPDGGAVAVWSSSSLGTAILFGDPALRLRLAPAARQHLPLVKR